MSRHLRLRTALSMGLTLGLSACATGPEIDVMIHDSPRRAVYLERIPDRSFQAAHPIALPADTIARILRGVYVKDNQGLLQTLVAGKPEAVHAFNDEEIVYLAPLLVEGFAKAASDQQVGFRLTQVGTPTYSQTVGAAVGSSEPPLSLAPTESTKGSLYAYGRSLYFTLTEYRRRPERGDTINMANRRIPDATGLANRTIHFVPESAKRPDRYRTARSTNFTLVIDYEMLAAMPAAPDMQPAAVQSTTSVSTPAQTPAKGDSSQRDTDLEALRKELQDIKKKLAEQEAERTRSIPSSPKPRSIP